MNENHISYTLDAQFYDKQNAEAQCCNKLLLEDLNYNVDKAFRNSSLPTVT